MLLKQNWNLKEFALKQDKITHGHGKVVNIYIVCGKSKNFNISSYSALGNCLFGVVSLIKDPDIDKYKYSKYSIGFDRHGFFHILVVELVEM